MVVVEETHEAITSRLETRNIQASFMNLFQLMAN